MLSEKNYCYYFTVHSHKYNVGTKQWWYSKIHRNQQNKQQAGLPTEVVINEFHKSMLLDNIYAVEAKQQINRFLVFRI